MIKDGGNREITACIEIASMKWKSADIINNTWWTYSSANQD